MIYRAHTFTLGTLFVLCSPLFADPPPSRQSGPHPTRPQPKARTNKVAISTLTISKGCPVQRASYMKQITAQKERLKMCHLMQLYPKPTLAGSLTVTWSLNDKGAATNIVLTKDSLQDTKLSSCVTSSFKRITPISPHVEPCSFDLTLTFSPTPP